MNRSLQLKLAAAGALLVAVLVGVYFFLSANIDPHTPTTGKRTEGVEQPLERARNILRKDGDLSACRLALQQVNAHLADPKTQQPPSLSAARQAELRQQQLILDESELAEVTSPHFTLLDGHHLELCLLLRDAARALETRPRADLHVEPQVEAAAAFAWVVRQVGLDQIESDLAHERRVLAPQFVLRRGYGSPLARSLLFLGLVEQLGLDGCLLALPGESGKETRYWVCGVLGEKDQLYLFDPRLGIPLPGPGGKGIATLAEVEGKASPLRQLDFGKELAYDITPEQAANSEVHLAPSLSALAPRMELLETKLLPPAVRVRLAAKPATARRFTQALKAGGHKKTEVKLAAWAARMQRRFLPKSEGGIDEPRPGMPGVQQNALRALFAPYLRLFVEALPPQIRPRRELEFQVPPINRLVGPFVEQFQSLLLAPGQPRDLILRGQYTEAQTALGPAYERALDQKKQFEILFKGNGPGVKALEEWYDVAGRVAARSGEGTGGLEEVNKQYGQVLSALIGGAGVDQRIAEIAFQQNLCQQEQAEHLQYRLDHFPKEVSDKEVEQAERLWRETRTSWANYLHLPTSLLEARRFQARGEEKLADVLALRSSRSQPERRDVLQEEACAARKQAVAFWLDLATQTPNLQTLAYRHHAQRLERLAVKVPLDKVPRKVLDAIKARFPGAKLLSASTENEDGKTVYEISLTYKDHHHDVTLQPDGTLLGIEREILAKELPKVVAEALAAKYPKATYKTVEELLKGDGQLYAYEILLVTPEKEKVEVVLDLNGKITKEEKKDKD
jgi:uncharacterized membrane protein YkoI